MEQQEIEALYHLRWVAPVSPYDQKQVVDYLAPRVGRVRDRITFNGLTVNVSLNKRERKRFLEFLRRRGLQDGLKMDDYYKTGLPRMKGERRKAWDRK